jgi:hypothetical protein
MTVRGHQRRAREPVNPRPGSASQPQFLVQQVIGPCIFILDRAREPELRRGGGRIQHAADFLVDAAGGEQDIHGADGARCGKQAHVEVAVVRLRSDPVALVTRKAGDHVLAVVHAH